MSDFKILYFAACSSYTSLSSETLPAPLPISKLYSTLEAKYPGITEKVLRSSLVTVNLEYVDIPHGHGAKEDQEEVVIQAGDEVAIIPPVSSG